MTALHEAERQLLWRPMSAREIADRSGVYTPKWMKQALETLVGKGIAIRETEPMICGSYRCRYRRSIARNGEVA